MTQEEQHHGDRETNSDSFWPWQLIHGQQIPSCEKEKSSHQMKRREEEEEEKKKKMSRMRMTQ